MVLWNILRLNLFFPMDQNNVSIYLGKALEKLSGKENAYDPPPDKTNKTTVRPAKTQISLGIRPVWSEFSLCTQWVAKDPSFLQADSEDSDQSGRMPRLIWVFAGCTCHFVGFVMRRLICASKQSYHSSIRHGQGYSFLKGALRQFSCLLSFS